MKVNARAPSNNRGNKKPQKKQTPPAVLDSSVNMMEAIFASVSANPAPAEETAESVQKKVWKECMVLRRSCGTCRRSCATSRR